jgi:hypothetical protein
MFHSGHAQIEEMEKAYPGFVTLSKPAAEDALIAGLGALLAPAVARATVG